ncbi:hypothetical protein DSL72_000731 [Monilinia vaccinii-corymbosi]|uniref:NADP-dependent oxidoreductase domain-containing protein n=1 Tax=Monilinia vaccinii-corymbosi TaxID=61207 RepID=A0A8A3P8R0_9HELO|nr:hypothetical protein DSL72_000731 [Monilinia vaccinii-corymbosi]
MATEIRFKSRIPIVLGAMTFGKPGVVQTRVHDIKDVSSMISLFQSYGYNEMDTARVYGKGSSEEYLGQLQPSYTDRGIIMATKLYPNNSVYPNNMDGSNITHSAKDLRLHLDRSLKALGVDKVDLFYLHAPDRNVPFEETFGMCDVLHKEGKFNRLGVSNFMSWEVAQVQEICIKNNWIRPTVYQGVYNAIQRSIEPELLPCLHHYNMSFYAFNPLAGGYLTSRYHRHQPTTSPTSRFDASTIQGQTYRKRYWNDSAFDALDLIREAASAARLSESECALRWLAHHARLDPERGDRIIVGASSQAHLRENLADLEKGPLAEGVLGALDRAWERTRGVVEGYWH